MSDTALRLVEHFQKHRFFDPDMQAAADAELRLLHSANEQLRAQNIELDAACAKLEAELAEQARVNGMGSEREARLKAVNAELVEALEAALHAFAEIRHAYMRPDWFTGGERSATQHLLMHQQRGSDAARAALAKAEAGK